MYQPDIVFNPSLADTVHNGDLQRTAGCQAQALARPVPHIVRIEDRGAAAYSSLILSNIGTAPLPPGDIIGQITDKFADVANLQFSHYDYLDPGSTREITVLLRLDYRMVEISRYQIWRGSAVDMQQKFVKTALGGWSSP